MELYFRDKLYITEELNKPEENVNTFIDNHIDDIKKQTDKDGKINLISLIQNIDAENSSAEEPQKPEPQEPIKKELDDTGNKVKDKASMLN